MYNGHNNDWEYVEQIPTSHQYGNEYQDENEDNADEPYEIESDFIEEEFEYDYDTSIKNFISHAFPIVSINSSGNSLI